MFLAFFRCHHVKGMQVLLTDSETLSGSSQMKWIIRHFLLMINLFFPLIDLIIAEDPLHRLFLLTMKPSLFLPQPTCLWFETRQIKCPIVTCDDLFTEEVTVLKIHAIIIFVVARLVVLRSCRIKRFYLVHLLLLMAPVILNLLIYIYI